MDVDEAENLTVQISNILTKIKQILLCTLVYFGCAMQLSLIYDVFNLIFEVKVAVVARYIL